jgi:hypothetical protein
LTILVFFGIDHSIFENPFLKTRSGPCSHQSRESSRQREGVGEKERDEIDIERETGRGHKGREQEDRMGSEGAD